MTAVLAAPMATLADIKRRAIPGARLLVVAHTARPELASATLVIVEDPVCSRHGTRPPVQRRCYDWVFEGDPADRYCSLWPAAMGVHIRDTDTFEYVLRPRARGNIIRLRFLPPAERI